MISDSAISAGLPFLPNLPFSTGKGQNAKIGQIFNGNKVWHWHSVNRRKKLLNNRRSAFFASNGAYDVTNSPLPPLVFVILLYMILPIQSNTQTSPMVLKVGLLGKQGLPSEQLLTMANKRLHELNLTDQDVYEISVKSSEMDSQKCPDGADSDKGSSQAMNLLFGSNVSAFFGPLCSDDLSLVARSTSGLDIVQFNFWRQSHRQAIAGLEPIVQMSTMSPENLVANIGAVLQLFNWHKIALITCPRCYDPSADQDLEFDTVIRQALIDHGIELLSVKSLEPAQNNGSLAQSTVAEQLRSLKNESRILLALLGTTLDAYVPFLGALQQLGMDTDEFVPILCIDRFVAKPMELPWQQPSGGASNVNMATLKLFECAIVIVNEFYDRGQAVEFGKQVGIETGTDVGQASLLMLSLQLYESFWTYALVLWRNFKATKDLQSFRNGTLLRQTMRQEAIKGPFGPIALSDRFIRLAPFRVYLVQANGTKGLVQIANISVSCNGNSGGSCTSLMATLIEGNQYLFAHFPLDVPSCGFNGELCDQRGTIIVAASIMVTICLGFIIFLCFRKVKRGETTQMPYYIPEQLIFFVDMDYGGSSNISIHSFQRHAREEKDQQQQSEQAQSDEIFTRKMATIEQSFVTVESYKLKEKLSFDKRDMQLLFQMKQAVHDNINPFIGLCVERPAELWVIWRHCFRGTLADLLFANGNKATGGHDVGASVISLGSDQHLQQQQQQQGMPQRDILDNNFKGAFVRDIIKGLDFLHSSGIGYHGSLTATRCLIDSHWILKLSGFGVSRLLYKWRHNGVLSNGNGTLIQPLIPNEELHYYAPEVRAAIRSAVLRNRPEELEFSNLDGQCQDMYSFGAILYEILYRRSIVEVEDTSEGVGSLEAMEDEVGIFSAQAEERLPIFPEFPGEGGSGGGGVGSAVDADRVHPDLVALMRRCFGRVDQRPDANMARKITDATLKMPGSLVDQMIKNMEQYTNNLENLVKEQTGKLELEQQKAEQILLELLPKSVVDELRMGRRVEPQFYASVTIMYSDIVGFTSLCSESQPMEVVNLLNGMFRYFDHAISQHKAYKVETIGDAYMVAAGIPERTDTHVREIASIALMQREFLFDYEIPHKPGQHLRCRWGFNSGSVFTGVVGITAPRYCVFGTAVTLAAKMENSGQPDRIQMTLKSHQLLSEQFPEFRCTARGGVRIEGVGTLLTYWLDGYDQISDRSGTTTGSKRHLISSPVTPQTPPPILA